jgi:fatty-acyl-CoA synthase
MVTTERAAAPPVPAPPPDGDWQARFATEPGLTLEEMLRPFGVSQTLSFISAAGERETISYHQFAGRLAAAGQRLAAHGVRPGAAVATTVDTSLPSVIRALAVWTAGGTLVSLPPRPRRALAEEHTRTFGRVLAAIGCEYVITERDDNPTWPGIHAIPAASVDDAARDGRPTNALDLAVPDTALIQFTSGSLGAPKGVAIGREALAGHLTMISRCMGADPAHDVVATWLPFYHDFGLVCFFLTGLCARMNQVHLHPRGFATDPSSWLRLLAAEGGTITGAPHFGFRLAGRVPYPDGLDLSLVRVALNGGERIAWSELEDFQQVAGQFGFRWEAQLPVYGLAENTVGATCTLRAGSGPSRGPDGLASSGRALPGTTISCDGTAASPAGLRLGGPWLFSGYHTENGFEPRTGSEFETGDLGFVIDGDAFVLGRDSDVISVGGRNVFAEDVETVALRTGKPLAISCAAFTMETAGQRFGLCVEIGQRNAPGLTELARNVRSAISAELGTRVEPLVLVLPGAIPRTTSGKVQRGRCRTAYTSGELAAGGRRILAELT